MNLHLSFACACLGDITAATKVRLKFLYGDDMPKPPNMDDLESLELLSLVSKVTSELQNHLGISDKTLAEFVIAQHSQCKSLDQFKKKLDAMGADFPQSLIESVDRLVLAMHPKFKGRKNGVGELAEDGRSKVDEKTRVFKGLALPDREIPWEDDFVEDKSNGHAKENIDYFHTAYI